MSDIISYPAVFLFLLTFFHSGIYGQNDGGYLLHCEGYVFQKNTLRWGLEMPAGKNFRIVCVGYHANLQKGNEGLFEIGIRYKIFR